MINVLCKFHHLWNNWMLCGTVGNHTCLSIIAVMKSILIKGLHISHALYVIGFKFVMITFLLELAICLGPRLDVPHEPSWLN